MSDVLILPARESDVRAVFRIAEQAFPVPWPVEELRRELTRPMAVFRVLRADAQSPVVGFLNHWRVGDELELMNIAVDPAARRRGYASALLEDMFAYATAQRVGLITLEVRRSNSAAIALYEYHGFERVGVRPRYYSDNHEDAWVMTRGRARVARKGDAGR